MAKIFISYSRKDTDQVDSLIKFLESANHDVWVDTQDIRAGSQWQTSIVQAIAESDFFIIALSKNSTKSDNVRRELVIAVNHKKEIIPVCLQEVELPPEMQYQLAGIQRINFDNNSPKDQAALLSVLDKEGSAVQRPVTGPQAQPSIKNILAWKVLGLFVLIASIVAITLFTTRNPEKTPDIATITATATTTTTATATATATATTTATATATPEGVQLVNISVIEETFTPDVELDIKVMNRGNESAIVHTAYVHIQDFKVFFLEGCFPGGPGTALVTSETYDMDISDLGIGDNQKLPISQSIEPGEPDRFSIVLLPKTEFSQWILYKIKLELIYNKDNQRVLSDPIFFISTMGDASPTSAEYLYGYDLDKEAILKRYKYDIDGQFRSMNGIPSDEDLILSMIYNCYKKNLTMMRDIFSEEGKMLSEEDMILSDQAKKLFDEWNNGIKEAQ